MADELDPKDTPHIDKPPQPPAVDPAEFENLRGLVAKLEKNNAELLAEKKAAKEAAEKARLEAAKKGGDVEALEKSWNEKLQAEVGERESKIKQFEGMVSSLTVGATAATLAAEVFGEHADLMMPHVNKRLGYEIVDGNPRVRVMDAEGKPSAMTVDELKAEFRKSEKFAPFVVGTRATGGAAHAPRGSGGSLTMPRSQFDQMNAAQKVEFSRKGGRLTDG